MIKIENVEVFGWEHAIRGMRNPMNSWEKSDSWYQKCSETHCQECANSGGEGVCLLRSDDNTRVYKFGENDKELMMKLANGGPVHAKYRRMITVYVDITAPLYWWKEFDTYKVGTVANSCSTMHKIHEKEFTIDDFSCEHLVDIGNPHCVANYPNDEGGIDGWGPFDIMHLIIESLNKNRKNFIEATEQKSSHAKKYWWQMIQLLPSSYNQKRTVMLNYEVLVGVYKWRKEHKLDEWREFCKWIEQLPYSEIITGMDLTVLNKDFVIPKEENDNE